MEHVIRNFKTLAENDLRQDALAIAEAGYIAIDTASALERKLRVTGDELHIGEKTFSLTGRRIFFVGIGKCAFAGARAIEKILGERLAGGVALDIASNTETPSAKVEALTGTHPLPNGTNVQSSKRIIEFLSDLREDDLVIMLISGGGSTLLCLPDAPMTYLDESTLFHELTAHGASIQDINIVRKHISRARGGALAKAAYPAEVVTLIFSDVQRNDVHTISSGPTVLDTSTVADAQAILSKYNVIPPANTTFIETPKEANYFERVTNMLFLTNQDALLAMQNEAKRRGYATETVDDRFTGEARDVGHAVLEKLHTSPTNTALFYAGESTVTTAASRGKGGRNQEMALAALERIRDGELILSFASDGHDNTEHAGAIADTMSREHARAQNLSIGEYLDAHRSYDFFKTTGDALITGYTESNVSDLIVALKK